MPTLISNCADANSLAAAFTKAEKYAADNNFKLGKTKNDVSKMMAACAAAKPPDRPEVKFEDAGKTLTATVGKAKKSVLVIATKEAAAMDAGPILKHVEAMVNDIGTKFNALMYNMFAKGQNIQHFMGMGQEGCNALLVVVKEMQAKGNKGTKMMDFAKNADVVTFGKTITECGVKATAAMAEWDALAAQAGQIKTQVGQAEAEFKSVAVLLTKPEHAGGVKGVQAALQGMKAAISHVIDTGMPHGAGFLKVDGNTTVADIEGKADMGFKMILKACQDRMAQGQEIVRAVREAHEGSAIKSLQALAASS